MGNSLTPQTPSNGNSDNKTKLLYINFSKRQTEKVNICIHVVYLS